MRVQVTGPGRALSCHCLRLWLCRLARCRLNVPGYSLTITSKALLGAVRSVGCLPEHNRYASGHSSAVQSLWFEIPLCLQPRLDELASVSEI